MESETMTVAAGNAMEDAVAVGQEIVDYLAVGGCIDSLVLYSMPASMRELVCKILLSSSFMTSKGEVRH